MPGSPSGHSREGDNAIGFRQAGFGISGSSSAMFGDAQVNTLKIGANTVTVQFTATFPGDTDEQGVGVALNVASDTIVLGGPTMVFTSSTGLIAYGGGWVSANSNLTIDGTQVSFGGGDEAWVNAAHSGAASMWTSGRFHARSRWC
ncbi:MAG: hypothetical protein RL748_4001 [Pseudomonadota bacterium]